MSDFIVLDDRKADKKKTSGVSHSCFESVFIEYLVEDKNASHELSSLLMKIIANRGLCITPNIAFILVVIVDHKQFLILVYYLRNLL